MSSRCRRLVFTGCKFRTSHLFFFDAFFIWTFQFTLDTVEILPRVAAIRRPLFVSSFRIHYIQGVFQYIPISPHCVGPPTIRLPEDAFGEILEGSSVSAVS